MDYYWLGKGSPASQHPSQPFRPVSLLYLCMVVVVRHTLFFYDFCRFAVQVASFLLAAGLF